MCIVIGAVGVVMISAAVAFITTLSVVRKVISFGESGAVD
jgi:hypothetical protein